MIIKLLAIGGPLNGKFVPVRAEAVNDIQQAFTYRRGPGDRRSRIAVTNYSRRGFILGGDFVECIVADGIHRADAENQLRESIAADKAAQRRRMLRMGSSFFQSCSLAEPFTTDPAPYAADTSMRRFMEHIQRAICQGMGVPDSYVIARRGTYDPAILTDEDARVESLAPAEHPKPELQARRVKERAHDAFDNFDDDAKMRAHFRMKAGKALMLALRNRTPEEQAEIRRKYDLPG